MRIIAIAFAGLGLVGCVTTERVEFKPLASQQALVRDGRPAIVSRQKNSLVMVSPAMREARAGDRPVFVVGINNTTGTPQDFRVSAISVTQTVNGGQTDIAVIPFERLVAEEKTRQAIAAIGVGLSAASNSMAASRAGYYNSQSTVYTPRGTYNVQTVGYSPTAAAIAQSNANYQNEAMINSTIERGRENMAMLENTVIKDNTLMPGEWYGGKLFISPLADNSGQPKEYEISLQVGNERHQIRVTQTPMK